MFGKLGVLRGLVLVALWCRSRLWERRGDLFGSLQSWLLDVRTVSSNRVWWSR